jgi:hypothetical protein
MNLHNSILYDLQTKQITWYRQAETMSKCRWLGLGPPGADEAACLMSRKGRARSRRRKVDGHIRVATGRFIKKVHSLKVLQPAAREIT